MLQLSRFFELKIVRENVRLTREAVRDAKVHINLKVSGKNWKAANIFGTLA